MARTSNDFYILASVQLETKDIQTQLNQLSKNLVFNVDTKQIKIAGEELDVTTEAVRKNQDAVDDLTLSYQAGNLILDKTIKLITSMVDQVFELDSALTEFKKVSDLSGSSLDNYVSTLSAMGNTVARTGKPKCLTPDVRIANVH